jgi:hypothetical protein
LLNFDPHIKHRALVQSHVIHQSGYFQIVITLDRTLNTLYYKRFPFLTKIRNLIFLTVTVVVLVAISNLFQWWRYLRYVPLSKDINGTVTYLVQCTMTGDLLNVFSLQAVIGRMAPSILNLAMNCLIRSKRNVSSSNRISSKEFYFAYSLIAQNIIFFIVTLPHVVLSVIQIVNTFTIPTSQYATVIDTILSLGSWGNYVFEAIPFFMNLTFNKIFRNEVLGLFDHNN